MATANDCDIRGWTQQSSSPIFDGKWPSSSRATDVTFGANRTTGVAPIAATFVGGFDRSSGSDQDFHKNHYSWDFGETTGDTWPFSGKSKDSDTGAVAGHVYKTAGTYTATCTVRDSTTGATLRTETVDITVTDTDAAYPTTSTIVVNNVGDTDFTGKPTGATEVNSASFSDVMATYAASDTRILFKYGGTWACTANKSLLNIDNLHIGAYGTGTSPDSQGLFSNAPLINISDNVDALTLWSCNDIKIIGLKWSASDSDIGGQITTGNTGIKTTLIMDNQTTGGSVPIGWGNWRPTDDDILDGNAVINNNVQSPYTNNIYVGSDNLLVMGNKGRDCSISHVLRVFNSYLGVIAHNDLAESSQDNANGRHALKFHGIAENLIGTFAETGAGGLPHGTEFTVVHNNRFGSSGYWPVAAGPANASIDARMKDLIFEKNTFLADYGNNSSTLVNISLYLQTYYTTVRNNVIVGTGGGTSYTGVHIPNNGLLPARDYIYVYNNTIYNNDTISNTAYGINITDASATNIVVQNNAVSYPNSTGAKTLVGDSSGGATISNNSITNTPLFTDATNVTPLSRDFTLQGGSTLIDAGLPVPVYDDITDTARTGTFDLGAYNE